MSMSEPDQPEVPLEPKKDFEAELLAGTEEDQKIGKEPQEAPMDDRMLQSIQTKAMFEMSQAVKLMVENQQATRQVPYNEIKPVTPWNPEGKRDRVKLRGELFQHGYWVNPLMISEETVKLVNQLKPGRYWDRKIEVQRLRNGEINITWNNKKIEQRMEFNAKFPHFDDVVKHCIEERKLKEEKKRLGTVEEDEFLS